MMQSALGDDGCTAHSKLEAAVGFIEDEGEPI